MATGFKKKLRAIVMLPKGNIYTPSEPRERLQEKILEVLTHANDYGIGYMIGAENEIDLYEPLVNESTIKGKFANNEEIGIKPRKGKPYRVKLRPYLTQ